MSLPSPITFAPITGVVPCEPFTFTFWYNETNEGHVEGTTNTLTAWVGDATSDTILQTLASGDVVYPANSGWQVGWNPVVASAGEYFIAAAVVSSSKATYTTNSQLFTIDSGSDEPCVNAAATATVGHISTGGSLPTGTAAGASSSSTERTQLARGAIAGLVIGIIAILFGLLAAVIFLRRRRVLVARARRSQVHELPRYPPVVRVVPLPVGEHMKDMDTKSELGPPLDYDRESLRSVAPSYNHGDGPWTEARFEKSRPGF